MSVRFVKRVWNAVQAARLWTKAIDAIAEGSYGVAYESLRAYSKHAGESNPEYFLFRAFVAGNLGRAEESAMYLSRARSAIEQATSYNKTEKNYLHCYGDLMQERLFQVRPDLVSRGDIGMRDELDVNLVRSHLRKKFPLK